MITGLDHLVLTVADLDATLRFYRDGLGMRHETFAAGRSALHFGQHKINLHVAGKEFEPKAEHPTPGSADLCFLTDRPLTEVMDRLDRGRPSGLPRPGRADRRHGAADIDLRPRPGRQPDRDRPARLSAQSRRCSMPLIVRPTIRIRAPSRTVIRPTAGTIGV